MSIPIYGIEEDGKTPPLQKHAPSSNAQKQIKIISCHEPKENLLRYNDTYVPKQHTPPLQRMIVNNGTTRTRMLIFFGIRYMCIYGIISPLSKFSYTYSYRYIESIDEGYYLLP